MVGVGAPPHQSPHPGDQHQALSDAELDELLTGFGAVISGLSTRAGISWAQKAQRHFAGIELELTARLKESGASDHDIRRTSSAGGTRTKASANRAKKRASTVNANPDLAEDVKNGELPEESLDALAEASEKTGGDAANDTELVEDLKNTPPDQAKKTVTRWMERRDDPNNTQTRHDRQRNNRQVKTGHDDATGCETITLIGDTESITEIRKNARALARKLYAADGGRDIDPLNHPRTFNQRLYDAYHQLIVNGDSGPTSVRSMIHITLTVDDTAETGIRAAMVDGDGYLPQSVLDRYLCNSILALTLFNRKGETLWHGQTKRNATPAQYAALIARDRGCVLCGASPEFCQAHHVIPYNSAKRGPTDIDNLALVCEHGCHSRLHDQRLTLYYTTGPPRPDDGGRPSMTWHTRPATDNEIASQRHGSQKDRSRHNKRRSKRPNRDRSVQSSNPAQGAPGI